MKTICSVHCYAGDSEQVRHFLPSYLQYGHPVVIMSPTDSTVAIPGVESCYAGKRAYTGQESLDRQRLQMGALLTYDADWFLMHDSDSLLLSGAIPEYLYESDNVVWSNEVLDWRTHPSPYSPRIALQPPYFMSRAALERMVIAADKPVTDPITPFIDWFMMACMFEAGLEHRGFRDALSFPTHNDYHVKLMLEGVRVRGKYVLHSIKRPEVYDQLCAARSLYVSRQGLRVP